MKFKVTWTSGKEAEFETNECESVDAFAMRRWGMNSAAEVNEQFGVGIEVAAEGEEQTAAADTEAAADASLAAEADAAADVSADAAVAAEAAESEATEVVAPKSKKK